MIEPKLAPVRPRVALSDGSGPLLLEDEVRERLETNPGGFVELVGSVGCGKSIAIAHLAHVFNGESRLLLTDGLELATLAAAKLLNATAERLVVCASASLTDARTKVESWRLAPWTQDEWIEYLLSVHPADCDSVMRCVLADPNRSWLAGSPELWRVVLDRMATGVSMSDVKSGLRRELDTHLAAPISLSAVRECCFELQLCSSELQSMYMEILLKTAVRREPCSLLRHEQVQLVLAAEHIVNRLQSNESPELLEARLSNSLVREAALLIGGDPVIRAKLQRVLASPTREQHAMAASLLHATENGWVPRRGTAPLLSGAYLSGAHWHGIYLRRLETAGTDLTGADLSESRLGSASADGAQLSRSHFHGAQLKDFSARGAKLMAADFSFVRAPKADFNGADLTNANLEGALLKSANFSNVNLSGARCCRANFSEATLTFAQLADADFTGCNLSQSRLNGLALNTANFTGAEFAWAFLEACDLEHMRLPGANFYGAVLCRALLTGSQMPDARFRWANLSETGLADIEWERADLRDADLRGCTFHMGSSRSGLVGSPIASEGSRTGFYTDEYHEQEFKAPEEIRKANLCGADLRGAKIDNVDFYLVDLRGALYTREQEDVLRRCRAILETHV